MKNICKHMNAILREILQYKQIYNNIMMMRLSIVLYIIKVHTHSVSALFIDKTSDCEVLGIGRDNHEWVNMITN
jgi:hypothetical protein